MKWTKISDALHHLSKQAIAAITVALVVPAGTAITFAATGSLNHTSVAASSAASLSSYSSSFAVSDMRSSSIATSSDAASSSVISSSQKGSDNTADGINAINQATEAGLNKINSAANQAVEKIQGTNPASTPSKLSPEEARKQAEQAWAKMSPEERAQRTYYELPDPYNTWKGLDPQTPAYDAAVKTYNDYAASVGVAQDALHTAPYKSQAITIWFKDHPQYCQSKPEK